MHPSRPSLLALAAAVAVAASASRSAGQPEPQLLYVTEGNRLRRIDVDTVDRPPLAQDVLVRLDSLGHRLRLLGAHSTNMGRGNAVMHDAATGVNFGASDPRADGAAIPEPLD